MTPLLSLDQFLRPGESFHLQSDIRTRRWGVPCHTHDFAEVFWIFQGSGRHHVNGGSVDLAAGAVVFVRPRDVHSVETRPHGALSFANLAFPAAHLRRIRRRYFPPGAAWRWAPSALPSVCALEPAQLTRLHGWTEELDAAPRTAFALDHFLLNLLHLTSAGLRGEAPRAGTPDWLARACRGIREREAMREGVPAWVRLCGRGPEHVARTTRVWLGVSPTEYVNRVRLEFMERQLRTTSAAILDLVDSAGFASVGHAYQQFKARFGQPPHRYRRAHQRPLV